MNTRMAEKYYAKRRRNMALFFSLAGHAIAIILTAVLVLKPKIEQMMENSITVEFVQPQQYQRPHVPKKIVREVKRRQPTAAPSIAADLAPSPEAIPSATDVPSATIERGSGEIEGGNAVLGSGNSGEIVGRRSGGSGESLGNLTQSGGSGQDGLGEGIPETLGSYRTEIGDKLGSIINDRNAQEFFESDNGGLLLDI